MMDVPEEKRVNVVCPVCSKSKQIPIPKDIITKPEGLTTLSVPPNIVSQHGFQLYLDQNFLIRGYLTSDFEVQIVGQQGPANPKTVNPSELLKIFGEDVLSLLIESLITNSITFIIGVQAGDIDHIKQEFLKIVPELEKRLYILGREEYNQVWKVRVYSSEFRDSFVFDFSLGVLVKSPEKNKKSKFGLFVLNDLKNTRGDAAQSVMLRNWNKKIELLAENVNQLYSKDNKLKSKDIIKTLEKTANYNEKNIPFEVLVNRLVATKGPMFAGLL
jgi:hypothetical protein